MSSQMKFVMTLLAALIAGNSIACADAVDETALREYAAQKRPDRVDAETRRLKQLYPNWVIPADLWTAKPSGPDEDPLWDLFEAGKLDELHKAIDTRKATQNGWLPSDDLLKKLAARELRNEFLADTAQNDWVAAARLAKTRNLAGLSDDIEMQWALAEAFARTEQTARAVDIYRAVLSNKAQQAKWAATILKALATLPMSDVDGLIAMVKSANGNELDAISVDITRARIVAGLRGEPVKPIDLTKLAEFEDSVRTSAPQQAGLLAWYSFRSGDFDKALEWFKWSIARGGDATIAHGLALTLIKLGFQQEAEDVAFAWHEQSVNNAILFIDVLERQLTQTSPPQIEPARLARYAQLTLQLQSGEGAQALAWYAYNSCQFKTALEWFQRAAAWFPKETTVFGYALTLQRMNRQREFLDTVNRYDGLFPSVVGLLFREEYVRPPTVCDRPAVAQAANSNDRGTPRLMDANFILASRSTLRMAPRSEFPLPATPENPLFLTAPDTPDATLPIAAQASRKEPRFDRPLIARRVIGAAPMPYERFNIALLPAWNGATATSFPAAVDRPTANGTIWSQEAAVSERDGQTKPTQERAAIGANRFHP